MNNKEIARATIFASLYVAVGLVIPFIGFGLIQCRVSDGLFPLIMIFGDSSIIGLTLGALIYNSYGFVTGFALGWLDLLSPIIFIAPKILIKKYGWAGVFIHILVISLWVGYLLQRLYHTPFLIGFTTVLIGESVAELGIGYLVYKGMQKREGFLRSNLS